MQLHTNTNTEMYTHAHVQHTAHITHQAAHIRHTLHTVPAAQLAEHSTHAIHMHIAQHTSCIMSLLKPTTERDTRIEMCNC